MEEGEERILIRVYVLFNTVDVKRLSAEGERLLNAMNSMRDLVAGDPFQDRFQFQFLSPVGDKELPVFPDGFQEIADKHEFLLAVDLPLNDATPISGFGLFLGYWCFRYRPVGVSDRSPNCLLIGLPEVHQSTAFERLPIDYLDVEGLDADAAALEKLLIEIESRFEESDETRYPAHLQAAIKEMSETIPAVMNQPEGVLQYGAGEPDLNQFHVLLVSKKARLMERFRLLQSVQHRLSILCSRVDDIDAYVYAKDCDSDHWPNRIRWILTSIFETNTGCEDGTQDQLFTELERVSDILTDERDQKDLRELVAVLRLLDEKINDDLLPQPSRSSPHELGASEIKLRECASAEQLRKLLAVVKALYAQALNDLHDWQSALESTFGVNAPQSSTLTGRTKKLCDKVPTP